jgi:hypothetical protein
MIATASDHLLGLPRPCGYPDPIDDGALGQELTSGTYRRRRSVVCKTPERGVVLGCTDTRPTLIFP